MSGDLKTSFELINPVLKASLIFKVVEGSQYALKISHSKTTAVAIMKALEPGSKATEWLLRFDNAHKNVPYAHINLRHKFTGIKDPHTYLPPGSLYGIQGAAYIGKALDYACYIALIIDGCKLGKAIYKDYQERTLNNTVECASNITGSWTGTYMGATAGSVLGGCIIAGVGPIIGAVGLGYLGAKYGGGLASATVAALKDSKEQSLEEQRNTDKILLQFFVPSASPRWLTN